PPPLRRTALADEGGEVAECLAVPAGDEGFKDLGRGLGCLEPQVDGGADGLVLQVVAHRPHVDADAVVHSSSSAGAVVSPRRMAPIICLDLLVVPGDITFGAVAKPQWSADIPLCGACIRRERRAVPVRADSRRPLSGHSVELPNPGP